MKARVRVKTEVHEARTWGEIMLERVKDASSEREGSAFRPLRRRTGLGRRQRLRQPEGFRATGCRARKDSRRESGGDGQLGFFFSFELAKQRCCPPSQVSDP